MRMRMRIRIRIIRMMIVPTTYGPTPNSKQSRSKRKKCNNNESKNKNKEDNNNNNNNKVGRRKRPAIATPLVRTTRMVVNQIFLADIIQKKDETTSTSTGPAVVTKKKEYPY